VEIEVIAWGRTGAEMLKCEVDDVILITNLSIKQYLNTHHLKFDFCSRIYSNLEEVD